MTRSLSLYNPRDTDPAQLDQLLTGRSALLDEILADLRQQARGKTRQHWLLRGQRGIGKTHLEGVIYHRVKTSPELAKAYLPLWLGEADVYEVYSAAKLLEKIGERLSEELKDSAIRERIRNIEGTGDDEMLFAALDELLTAEAKGRQRILLVLVENLDALFERFAPKDRSAQLGQLRSLLLHNPWLLFIGTTPTRYLKGLESPKEPLYAQLKTRDLDRLTEPELGELYKRLATAQGRKDIEEALFGSREGALRLRVIHQLTGGLPRSAAMAFTILQANTHGLKPMVEEMRELLEKQTAYFEARLARLAARESAIVTAMALAPRNLTLKEIAERSRLPERSLSTLMDRLEKDGHVRVAPHSTGKGKGTYYELSEELFRLWYQYRSGRPVLEPLVWFIANWFDHQQLEEAARQIREGSEEGENGDPRITRLTLLQIEEALRIATSEEGRRAREQLWDECRKATMDAAAPGLLPDASKRELAALFEQAMSAISARDIATANQLLGRLDEHLKAMSLSEGSRLLGMALRVARCYVLIPEGNVQEAISRGEQMAREWEQLPGPSSNPFLALVFSTLFLAYLNTGALTKLRATKSRVLKHFGDAPDLMSRRLVSDALFAESSLRLTVDGEATRLADLSEWLRRFKEDPAFRSLKPLVEFRRALAQAITGELVEGGETIDRLISSQNSIAREMLLNNASVLIALFGPARERRWLEMIGVDSLRPELRRKHEIFTLGVDVLLAGEDSETPAEKARLRKQALARVPPELRPTIEEMVRRLGTNSRNAANPERRPSAQKSSSKTRKR